jgi:hypothetical protein
MHDILHTLALVAAYWFMWVCVAGFAFALVFMVSLMFIDDDDGP